MTDEYTPLDSLKEIFWVTMNTLGVVQDMLAAGFDHDPDDVHDADPLIESVKGELVKALARHVPGIRYAGEGLIEYTEAARTASKTYDDGTLIKVSLQSTNGWLVQDYYPRRDGPRWAFQERLERASKRREAEVREYEAQQGGEAL